MRLKQIFKDNLFEIKFNYLKMCMLGSVSHNKSISFYSHSDSSKHELDFAPSKRRKVDSEKANVKFSTFPMPASNGGAKTVGPVKSILKKTTPPSRNTTRQFKAEQKKFTKRANTNNRRKSASIIIVSANKKKDFLIYMQK